MLDGVRWSAFVLLDAAIERLTRCARLLSSAGVCSGGVPIVFALRVRHAQSGWLGIVGHEPAVSARILDPIARANSALRAHRAAEKCRMWGESGGQLAPRNTELVGPAVEVFDNRCWSNSTVRLTRPRGLGSPEGSPGAVGCVS